MFAKTLRLRILFVLRCCDAEYLAVSCLVARGPEKIDSASWNVITPCVSPRHVTSHLVVALCIVSLQEEHGHLRNDSYVFGRQR